MTESTKRRPSDGGTGASDRVAPRATIFFDVNETLSDLSTVADAFESVGTQRPLAAAWFATVLRDAFALTATGSAASFPDIARNSARAVLSGTDLDRSLDDATDAVLDAFSRVGVHPDVVEGIRALRAAGHRLFTLSNGPTATAERLLGDAGVLSAFDGLLSVEGHTPWKPAPAAYLGALARTGTAGPAYLVAVHPWDIHGAATAGLSTAWVDRAGAPYPAHFTPPTVTVGRIGELAERLGSSA